MVPIGLRGLVARHAVADIDPLDEALLQQRLEHPVDARDADRAPVGAHAVVDLLRYTQHCWRPRKSTTARRAPPLRKPAARRSRAWLLQVLAVAILMIPILKDVLPSCRVFENRSRHGALAAFAPAAATPRATGGTDVVAAFYPLAYAAEQVGGTSVSVRNLTPAGSEPHDFELSAGDVRAVVDADLVVYLGGGFQPAVEQALAMPGRAVGRPARGAARGGRRGGMREVDPHVWLDPVRFARRTGDRGALGPAASADGLAARLRGSTGTSSEGSRAARDEIVTSHAAFGYLAKRYGLEQLPLTGITPEAEPSPRDLETLVRQVEASAPRRCSSRASSRRSWPRRSRARPR